MEGQQIMLPFFAQLKYRCRFYIDGVDTIEWMGHQQLLRQVSFSALTVWYYCLEKALLKQKNDYNTCTLRD
jgi:hypothetical protein